MKDKKEIGLALSGGGARGIAHLGLLKALEEWNIAISVISGTSAGAMIAAFYAGGYSVEQILDISIKNNFFKWYDFAFSKKGLLKIDSNEKLFRNYLGDRKFADLKMPVYLSAADIQSGQITILSEGDVVTAILASSAIPILFEPVKRKGRLLIDGSAGDCFPVDSLIGKCDFLIGSYVNAVSPTERKLEMPEIFDRGFHMSLQTEIKQKRANCSIYLAPELLTNYTMFDFEKAREIFEIGYQNALSQMNEFKMLGLCG